MTRGCRLCDLKKGEGCGGRVRVRVRVFKHQAILMCLFNLFPFCLLLALLPLEKGDKGMWIIHVKGERYIECVRGYSLL